MQKVEKPGKQSGAKVGIQLENRVVRKCANLVDLEKYCNVNIVFKKSNEGIGSKIRLSECGYVMLIPC